MRNRSQISLSLFRTRSEGPLSTLSSQPYVTQHWSGWAQSRHSLQRPSMSAMGRLQHVTNTRLIRARHAEESTKSYD